MHVVVLMPVRVVVVRGEGGLGVSIPGVDLGEGGAVDEEAVVSQRGEAGADAFPGMEVAY